ncbi:MAG: hypothetical protein WBP64_19200 [Nitrososphaeraceae archaeon]
MPYIIDKNSLIHDDIFKRPIDEDSLAIFQQVRKKRKYLSMTYLERKDGTIHQR